MIVSLVAPCFMGQNNNIETDVAVQEESTEQKTEATQQAIDCAKQLNFDIKYGYTTENINIRTEPSFSSEIYGVCPFNTFIFYIEYDEDWVKVSVVLDETNGQTQTMYLSKQYISDVPCVYTEYSIPDNNGFKSYMPYTSITDETSKQHKLQKEYAYTGDYGIRSINYRYCVAVGTAFNAEIGDYADLILENGEIIPVIISDIKDDKDTDNNNIATIHNGCVSEFIIDTKVLSDDVMKHGDVSIIKDEWNSKVVSVKIYDKNVLEE